MKKIIQKIYSSKKLNLLDSYNLFNSIFSNPINNCELSSILIAMKIRGEGQKEILSLIKLFSKNAKLFPSPKYKFADIVGTGGDKSNSINISTLSAFVAASYGIKIAKHCNAAITSKIGSANILKKLKINLNITPQESRLSLDKLNICFLLAPIYYPIFQSVSHIRKKLNTRTIFNIIGPMLNPAKPKFILIGVYHIKWLLPVAKMLKKLNYKHAIVVHSANTDEITLFEKTYVAELKEKLISSYEIYPSDFGFKKFLKKDNKKNQNNYDIAIKTLQGKGQKIHEYTIAANVAMLLKLFGKENLKYNAQEALEIIRNGTAYKKILLLSKLGKSCKK
ncbi:anthranilate phosphoribosyltransferase [Buchnera aphidicola (Kurisakia onigurumii)]|uniref:anthranilate phosphoribosyltransferase n=1 Tax=Buchnera aphidicola TaxID=9 RepID=UPI0031B69435